MVNKWWALCFFLVFQLVTSIVSGQNAKHVIVGTKPKEIGYDAVLLDRDFKGLKFFKANVDMDDFMIFHDLYFISSIPDSIVLVTDKNSILYSVSLKGLKGFGTYVRPFFDPHFYYDNTNPYWGRYSSFDIMKFYKKRKKWKSEIITSYENNYLPENKTYIKIIDYSGFKIIIEHARGTS